MRRVTVLILAFSIFVGACAGERPVLDEGAAREVDAADPALLADVPVRPTVRLAVSGDWSGDPADAGPASITARVMADLLFEGLTRLDAAGQPEAALAERWFVSDDRLTWTFVLPDGLTDGDGAPLDAADVKRSLERVAARGATDQAAPALSPVTGWDAFMAGEAGGVAGITAPDPTTVVIELDEPFEILLDVLASPAYGITVEGEDGVLGTTGAFRRTDDPARFVAVDADSGVAAVELVDDTDGPLAAMEAGTADWAVLGPDDDPTGLDADILRQPLDLQVAVVARAAEADVRLGTLGALSPLLLAGAVDGLTALGPSADIDSGVAPPAVLLDVPAGTLQPLGTAISEQLVEAGIEVMMILSEPGEFAARVAAGDATLFPVVIAGGIGPVDGVMRLATPGAIDDVFGPGSEARDQLSAAVMEEIDVEQRDLFAQALEQALVDDGYLLPIGRYEVRIAMGTRLAGLVHRADGTLDVSAVTLRG